MATVSITGNYTNNVDTASGAEVESDFNALANLVNGNITSDNIATGGIVTANLADNSVTTAKLADSVDVIGILSEMLYDCKTGVSDFMVSTGASLTDVTIKGGDIYIDGQKYTSINTDTTLDFTDNEENYVHMNSSGTFEVKSNSVPSTGYTPVCMVTTSGGAITKTGSLIRTTSIASDTQTPYTPRDYKRGCRLYWKDANEVYVSEGDIAINNARTADYMVCRNRSATAVTFSVGASTLYYVYAIPNGNTGFSLVHSTTAPSSYNTYDYFRYLGSFVTNSSSDILPFMYTGNTCRLQYYDEEVAFSTLTDNTWTNSSALTVPETATMGIFQVSATANVSGSDLIFYALPYGYTTTDLAYRMGGTFSGGNPGISMVAGEFTCGLASSKIQYKVDADATGDIKFRLDLVGWVEEFDE